MRHDLPSLLSRIALAGFMLTGLTLWPSVAPAQSVPPTSDHSYSFEGGFPTQDAANKGRDDIDLNRAILAYRFFYPTVSTEGIFNGNRELGLKDNESLPILSAAPHHVGFTLNSDTPYSGGPLDLTDGPMVVELPPGPFIALVDDHHQRWVMDMGLPGPDAGKGGKHLILPPGYTGAVPEGYHVGQAQSFKVLLAIRSLPVNGDVEKAMDGLRSIKVYSLASAANPKLVNFVDTTAIKSDMSPLRWEDNLLYWQVLHQIIDAEPMVEAFGPMYGQLAALGIEKGKDFAPDSRMTGILEEAATVGRDQMLISAFASDRPDRVTWPDRAWEWVGLVPDNADFETPGGLDVEARDRWFGQAIVTSPAMFRRQVGAGSLYWLAARDESGAYLDGGKTYKLTVPLPVPAKLFWSVTAYDAATRSEVQNDDDKAALRSLFELRDDLAKLGGASGSDAGGSIDLSFGPNPPAIGAEHWIKTMPGQGWFAYFRIYGPEQAAFDGSWKPGDLEVLPAEATGNSAPTQQ